MKWIFLAAGGLLGTFARHGVVLVTKEIYKGNFPYATLVVNLTGCFLIGFLAVYFKERFHLEPELHLLLLAGFCGAFTTFSTLMMETSDLLTRGSLIHACLNLFTSVTAGLILFRLGAILAKAV
jgi:fluoride exporter